MHFYYLTFNWTTFLFGEDDWKFLFEVIVRSTIMFIIVLWSLRIMGRRAVMQGVFEIALIISLGSAAGDAMFYSKVGLLPAILVFIVIILQYRIIDFLMLKFPVLENKIEGTPIHLINEGVFYTRVLKKEVLTRNEIFADLRMHSVSHLGQVKSAYIEPSGSLSIYFHPDDDTKYGLPILPEKLKRKQKEVTDKGFYACVYCGDTKHYSIAIPNFKCENCAHGECLQAEKGTRLN
jgi:uncharacterized membrane protein YcaP (DUF421 family)